MSWWENNCVKCFRCFYSHKWNPRKNPSWQWLWSSSRLKSVRRRSWGRAIWCRAWWTTEATSATTSVTSTSPRWPPSSSATTGWSAASWTSAAKTSTLCTVAASAPERRWDASFIYYQTWTTTKQIVSGSLITHESVQHVVILGERKQSSFHKIVGTVFTSSCVLLWKRCAAKAECCPDLTVWTSIWGKEW